MPSTNNVAAALSALVGVVVLLYFLLVAHQFLLGAAIALGFLLIAALLATGDTDRETVVAVTMAVTVVYGVFTLQLPAAVVAACVVYLTAWVTGPEGPFDAEPPGVFPDVAGDADSEGASDESARE